MKTSKRLLSILLMLTMLLSMFTVMASAGTTPEGQPEWSVGKRNAELTDDQVTCRYEHNSTNGTTYNEVEATCTTPGHKYYWVCGICGQRWTGALKGWPMTEEEVIIPAGHDLEAVAEKPATCTDDGTEAYWKCKKCGEKFSDAAGTKVISAPGTISAHHTLTQHAKVEATCTAPGTEAYWECTKCSKLFSDAAGNQAIENPVTIPALTHNLTHHPRVEATVDEAGNIEYWTCDRCSKYFDDANGTHEISEAETVIPMIPSYTLTVEVEKIATKTPGKVTYNGAEIGSFTKQIKGAQITLKAEAYKGYQFKKWVISGTGAKVSNETAATTTVTIGTANAKITAVFEEKPMTELEVQVFGSSHGEVYYRYNKEDSEKLKTTSKTWDMDATTDKVKFWVYPDSGYKAVLQFNDGRKVTYTYGDSVEIDHYDLEGEDGVLSISFVKKSSSDVDDYPTLTFDITGGKHGTVYRGSREYEDGDVISIKKNDKMTFKAKADKGYVAVWTYKGDTYVGDEYTVKMGATDAKLYVEFMDKDDIRLTELPFRDVSKRDWYYDDVVYVYRKGYMDGMSSTRFGGELNTTRGQIVTILWRLTGEPRATKRNPFTDVSSSQYYYDAISWAYDAGVVDGFDAHTFKPDQNVTREQLAAILYRYAEYMNLSTSGSAYLSKYRDADKIANWAYDAMAWANYRGLINGTSATRIDPKGYATRAQIAAILHRFAVEYGA